jgi:hypothetical protein
LLQAFSFFALSPFAPERAHNISNDEAQNQDQRDQNDLGHGYLPEIQSQRDHLGVLYQKDDEQNSEYYSTNNFWVFHKSSFLRGNSG